jgi:hypothetical protein
VSCWLSFLNIALTLPITPIFWLTAENVEGMGLSSGEKMTSRGDGSIALNSAED